MDPNLVFFLSLTLIVLGYIIKKLNIITEEEGKGIAKLILNVTLPALILDTIPEIDFIPELILLFFLCIGYSLIVLGVGFLIFRNAEHKHKGILFMCIIGYNIGLFAYPLIEGIWGEEGIQHIALFDFGNAFIIFALCYAIAAYFSPKNSVSQDNDKQDKHELIKIDFKYIFKRIFTSVPLITYIIAIILNLLNFEFSFFFSELIGIVSRANMALTLILLGIYLNFKFEKSEWKEIFKVLLIRYSFGISIGLILFFTLPFSALYRTILLIALIMPVGMAVIPFAVQYGHDEELTGIIVNLTIIISFILMWIITLIVGV